VGRIEPRIDRATSTLRVLGMWWEEGFDPLGAGNPGFVDAFVAALRAHAAFADLRKIALPRTARDRAFVRAIRERL
jgi:uncharacterized protein YcaQ